VSLAQRFTVRREPGDTDKFGRRGGQEGKTSHDYIRFLFAIRLTGEGELCQGELGPD